MKFKKDYIDWLFRLLLPISIKFLPPWISGIITVIIEIVDGLPEKDKPIAKKEIKEAAQRFRVTGDPKPIAKVAKKYHKKYCEGPQCPLV